MFSFFQDLLQFRFLQYSLLTALLCSVSCGVIGSFVVVRRSTYIAGAIAHSVMGGLGFARYMQTIVGWQWMTPAVGAFMAAMLSSAIITYFTLQNKERIDTVLSAIWAIGMALGITFLVATPGYSEDLMSYLFGDILMVSRGDLLAMFILDAVIIVVVIFTYDQLLAISFNPQLALLKGVKVAWYEALFILLTGLTVVLLVRIVGIILVIALITLPPATAARLTRKLSKMIWLAIGFSLLYTIGGLIISYSPGLPAGPTMIELGVLVYGIVSIVSWNKYRTKT
jgi:zinc transport system permease protein